METRSFECRFEDDGVLRGVVVPYGTATRIGHFQERFARGAFAPLGEVRVNFQHDRKRPLAVNKEGGGLRLIDTPEALRAEVDLPDTADGRDARTLIKRGVLTGFSVEFRSLDEQWNGNVRTIKKAEFKRFAIVDRPEYEGAIIEEMRAAQDAYKEETGEFELWPLL